MLAQLKNIPVRDAVKIALLFGLSGYFLWNIATENLSNYINTRFGWLSWVAVVLFFAMGVVNLLPYFRKKSDNVNPLIQTNTVMPKGWSVMMICAIPLALGVLIPSKPLGVESLTGTLNTNVSVSKTTVITRDPLKRNILDWLRAFGLEADKTRFNGVEAEFSGFIYRNPEFTQGQFMVGRFIVSCCTADADPVGLPVYSLAAEDFAEGQWVTVRGKFTVGEFRNSITPILQAEIVTPIEQPKNSYLYP